MALNDIIEGIFVISCYSPHLCFGYLGLCSASVGKHTSALFMMGERKLFMVSKLIGLFCRV